MWLASALAPAQAHAGTVLYCNDYSLGTDHMANALSALSSVHTITSTASISACENYISGSAWDLVILAIQNNNYTTPYFVAYVASGGRAILQDWTRDSTRGAAVGITYASVNSGSMTVTHPVLGAGLSSTSQSFTNPGWSIYTTGMSTTTGSAATFASGDMAIGINNASTAIINGFLTDTLVNAADAERLYINEIDFLIGGCDADGDGFDDIGACGGTDCDDTDPTVFPGAPETCNGVDDDCDGTIDEDDAIDASIWYADTDADGYGDALTTDTECTQPSGYVADNTDCDDTDAAIHPSATEVCNGVDDDCDGAIDEAGATGTITTYADADGDGFGDPSVTEESCTPASGYVADNTDCNDADAAVYPGADEWCNGQDDDCDGVIDEGDALDALDWYRDLDGDLYGDAAVISRECSPPTGYVTDSTDCDDADRSVYPGATEYCNGQDDDCDGTIDESDAVDARDWHPDADGDTYGDPSLTVRDCLTPAGHVADDSDCDDTDPAIHPGATEVSYDGVDQDCDGEDLCDADADSWNAAECGGDDCDDEDADIRPDASEIWYDGVDQDCDEADDYDADGDGHASASYTGDDCDDADPSVYPGAVDAPYDGIINDCDDSDEYDADGDGHDAIPYGGDDCDDANSSIHPGASETWYDGLDQDCDGNDDDQDEDGYSVSVDCDDTDPAVYPGDGVYDDECNDALTPELDTGGLSSDDIGAATGGGGLKGCAASKTASLFGGLGLWLLALGRRRRADVHAEK